MILKTDRLLLRRFEGGDIVDYNRIIFEDPAVTETLVGYNPPYTLDNVRRLVANYNREWEQEGFGPLAVIEQASGRFVGHAGITLLHAHESPEILTAIGYAWWGESVASESCAASLYLAFEVSHVDHVCALVDLDDTHTRRVLTRLGLEHDGNRPVGGTTAGMYVIAAQDYTPSGLRVEILR
ncbi:MAG: GNAT family N-acetyltransferase [Chloroflexi bacterium]|nr:GNAT family N-acetyltransferase [Chloroflexota bacterium]